MKILKKSINFLVFSVLLGTLTSCDWNIFKKNNSATKDPLVIPTVDVTSMNINLPELPTRNVGEIRNDDNYEYIDLYELSDFHGAVNYESHSEGDYIGLPKLATYLDQKRANNPGGTLVLSSGDMFQGSADSNLTRGYMVNYCMQYMGFDAMAVGNHEFDWTDEWLEKNAKLHYGDYSIPYLGANILKNGEVPDFLQKSTVITRGKYKIGVIGVIGSNLESSVLKTALENYEFVRYDEIVQTEANRLRTEENCQAVVLLAHEGANAIESTTGIDAVFGGHAHKDTVSHYGAIPAIGTYNYGQSVGHIALKFNKENQEYVGVEEGYGLEAMRSVAGSLSENSDINSIMSQYAPEIDKIKNIKLATADGKLSIGGALINICTETMFNVATEAAKANSFMNIDSKKIIASFHNSSGGIRDDILKGDVTYGNVYKSFPFDNEIVMFKATGSELRTGLKTLKSLGCYRLFEDKEYFNPGEEYYIVTTDYLAFSEKGMVPFKSLDDEDLIRTGAVVRDEVAKSMYEIDKLENSKLLHTGDYHYKSIPLNF